MGKRGGQVSGVKEGVKQVHQQVGGHDKEETDEGDGQYDRKVGVDQHLHGQAAKAGQAEHQFDKDRAVADGDHDQPQLGDHRGQHGAQDVAQGDHMFGHTLSAGGADVILGHHLDHRGAGLAQDQGDRLERQDGQRQQDEQVKHPAPTIRHCTLGQDHDQQHHQQRPRDVGGNRPQGDGGAKDDVIEPRVLPHARDHPQGYGDQRRHDHGAQAQPQRNGCCGGNHVPNQAARGQAVAEIAVQKVPDIRAELHQKRAVQPGLFADRLDLGRVIGHIAGGAQENQLDRVARAIKCQRIDRQHHQQNRGHPKGQTVKDMAKHGRHPG